MRVLLAYDGSPCARAALQLAAGLPWPAASRLTVLSVLDLPDIIGAGGPVLLYAAAEQREGEMAAAAHRSLDEVAAQLRGHGRTVDTRLEHGRPASVILEAAAELAVDLVVVGSRGLGPWTMPLLGSVSTEVVDHAPCPVLVARHERIERLVVATDGSTSADRAIDTIRSWRLFTGLPAQALVVDTVRPASADWAVALGTGWIEDHPEELTEVTVERQQRAAQAASRLREAGIAADPVVRRGDAAQQIVEAAHDSGDLVVVGSRGLGTFSRLLLGSVARKVLLHTAASVLVVRRPHATAGVRAPAASVTGLAF